MRKVSRYRRHDELLERHPNLKPFAWHGVELTKTWPANSGLQASGRCPDCDGKDKFCINVEKQLWDCKVCGASGNLHQFLEARSRIYNENLSNEQIRDLASDRGLPPEAFDDVDLGWDGEYTLAVRDSRGHVVDIRRWRLTKSLKKRQFYSTAGVQVGLFGSHRLSVDPDKDVFVCEGEWDAIALRHLLRLASQLGTVVAVPGANTFKQEWAGWVRGRRVFALYDNDEAGARGELRLHGRLRGVASELHFIRWPSGDEFLDGFDTRDWVVGCLQGDDPEKGWHELKKLFRDEPRLDKPIDVSTTGADPKPDSKERQLDRLMRVAEPVELFHSPDGTAYGTFPLQGKTRATAPVQSSAFRAWWCLAFNESEGRAASSNMLKDATELLAAKVRFKGPCLDVFVRVGQSGGAIYLDLGDREYRAVRITARGWKVVRPRRVRFFRPGGMRPLPRPKRGGRLDLLRGYINLSSDEDWALLLGWLVVSLWPEGPYPLLVLKGEQGSSKSTATRILRALVDPNAAPIRALPKSLEDLAVSARNSRLLAFDNVSRLDASLSDALCRLSTGGGFATRRFYTNEEEVLFEAQRPVILNGIEDITTRPDLIERAICLELPAIPEESRMTEKELWASFDKRHSAIFGGLCGALSTALARYADVVLEGTPRMADAITLATAAEPALGLQDGAFLDAYRRNAARANEVPLESSLVVAPLEELLKSEGGSLTTTATKLLAELNAFAGHETTRLRGWPQAANILSGELNRLAPSLRKVGIEVTFHRTPGGTSRLIKIVRHEGS